MEIRIPHVVIYETERLPSVSDVVDSLLGSERIVRQIPAFLEGSVDGLSIDRVELSVERIDEGGSLRQIFFVSVFLAFQEDLEREVPQVIQDLLGVPISDRYDTIVTVVSVLLLYYGLECTYTRIKASGEGRATRAQLDGLVKEAARQLGKTEEEVRAILAQKYTGSRIRSLAKGALQFFAPSKRQKNAPVRINNKRIESEVIKEIPTDIEIEEFGDDELHDPYQDVEIEIHAQDVDRAKAGWAGIIKGIHPDRLKMQVYPPINPQDIYTKTLIKGDIILTSRRTEGGDYKPHMFHLIRLRD